MSGNAAASIHRKLLNNARDARRPFNELLQYFAMERFLYRLSQSQYADRFILKGALVFRVWMPADSRATRDIDFLAFVDNSIDALTRIVRDIIHIDVPEDGLIFDADSIHTERIKEDADYEGIRVKFKGKLGKARVHMQLDVAFGDVVNPDAAQSVYPVLLGHPAPVLRIYPPETVLAEKLEAMLHLGALNSRMKDFYDVWRLSRHQAFDGQTLHHTIARTLENRSTEAIRFADLSEELIASDDKEAQWSAFLSKSNLAGPRRFEDLLTAIGILAAPMLDAIIDHSEFSGRWKDGGPWRNG